MYYPVKDLLQRLCLQTTMSKQGVHLRVLTVKVEEAVDEGEDLDGEGGADHVEGDGGQTVLLQESHQETKTNEDHHMDVLKH